MARYTGPVCRLCRRQGMKLFLKGERCFTPKCAVERRPTPPGAPPSNVRRRRKESEYSLQLKEKQKARNIYGILERQFHKHFVIAERMPGVTGYARNCDDGTVEIVEHDDVRAGGECCVELCERFHLDFDRQSVRALARGGDRDFHAPRQTKVVVLDQDHLRQVEPMVRAASVVCRSTT